MAASSPVESNTVVLSCGCRLHAKCYGEYEYQEYSVFRTKFEQAIE